MKRASLYAMGLLFIVPYGIGAELTIINKTDSKISVQRTVPPGYFTAQVLEPIEAAAQKNFTVEVGQGFIFHPSKKEVKTVKVVFERISPEATMAIEQKKNKLTYSVTQGSITFEKAKK